MRRGKKIESLPLEAKTEAEIIEQEDETMSETVEQKLKPWESKGGEGEGTKPKTMKQNVGDMNLNMCSRRKGNNISCKPWKAIRFDKES